MCPQPLNYHCVKIAYNSIAWIVKLIRFSSFFEECFRFSKIDGRALKQTTNNAGLNWLLFKINIRNLNTIFPLVFHIRRMNSTVAENEIIRRFDLSYVSTLKTFFTLFSYKKTRSNIVKSDVQSLLGFYRMPNFVINILYYKFNIREIIPLYVFVCTHTSFLNRL